MDTAAVKTRFFIISDTHGMDFDLADIPFPPADVAIHCGDLTYGSKLNEFRTTINILKDIDAPLKLAIAGNHDFTLHGIAFTKKVEEAVPLLDPELVAKEYGIAGEAKHIFEDAKEAGIILLDEGTHHFTLQNGARLTVYASPYTPALGAWGFQYSSERGHDFSIEKGVNVVITHGPPKGILDYTHGRERAGSADLFAAVADVKPQLHCFGHIHEGWGAKLVTWRDIHGERPTHFTAIDNDSSNVIETLASLNSSKLDTEEPAANKLKRLEGYNLARCCQTSHCTGDEYPVNSEQTLFVNASIQGSDGLLTQSPWLIDIELPRDSE
jgi:predicted phosphohydrolase